jgi:hypothetical protein
MKIPDNQASNIPEENIRNQFVRLAEALIRKKYGFKPQRKAVAAKMYRRWLERKYSIKT